MADSVFAIKNTKATQVKSCKCSYAALGVHVYADVDVGRCRMAKVVKGREKKEQESENASHLRTVLSL